MSPVPSWLYSVSPGVPLRRTRSPLPPLRFTLSMYINTRFWWSSVPFLFSIPSPEALWDHDPRGHRRGSLCDRLCAASLQPELAETPSPTFTHQHGQATPGCLSRQRSERLSIPLHCGSLSCGPCTTRLWLLSPSVTSLPFWFWVGPSWV